MSNGERTYLGKRLITGPEDGWTTTQRMNWIMTGDPDRALSVADASAAHQGTRERADDADAQG